MSSWWDKHQAALYLAALAAGALLGLLAGGTAGFWQAVMPPALVLLLFATFLGIPLLSLGQAFRDLKFLAWLLGLNFILMPLAAWLLSRLVAGTPGLLAGVLLVLLCPCVDYVVVFTALAGGAKDKLLAATPLLMAAQMLLLPLYLRLMGGRQLAAAVDYGQFGQAFAAYILLPLAAAALVQFLCRRYRAARAVSGIAAQSMVPVMMLVLLAVVASQLPALAGALGQLAPVFGLFALFAVTGVLAGLGAGKLARLPAAGHKALVFSATTRNSLVVLPLALALPAGFELAPLAVVAQTLVELCCLVAMVRLLPRLIGTPE